MNTRSDHHHPWIESSVEDCILLLAIIGLVALPTLVILLFE